LRKMTSGLDTFTLATSIEHLKHEIVRNTGKETYIKKKLKWEGIKPAKELIHYNRPTTRTTQRGFSQFLSDLELRELDGTGSPKCQFEAVAKALYGGTLHATALRNVAVAHMLLDMWGEDGKLSQADKDRHSSPGDFDNSLERIRKNTEYGTPITLQALATCLDIDIRIIQSTGYIHNYSYHALTSQTANKGAVVYLTLTGKIYKAVDRAPTSEVPSVLARPGPSTPHANPSVAGSVSSDSPDDSETIKINGLEYTVGELRMGTVYENRFRYELEPDSNGIKECYFLYKYDQDGDRRRRIPCQPIKLPSRKRTPAGPSRVRPMSLCPTTTEPRGEGPNADEVHEWASKLLDTVKDIYENFLERYQLEDLEATDSGKRLSPIFDHVCELVANGMKTISKELQRSLDVEFKVLVIGKEASGKSTLINALINFFIKPDQDLRKLVSATAKKILVYLDDAQPDEYDGRYNDLFVGEEDVSVEKVKQQLEDSLGVFPETRELLDADNDAFRQFNVHKDDIVATGPGEKGVSALVVEVALRPDMHWPAEFDLAFRSHACVYDLRRRALHIKEHGDLADYTVDEDADLNWDESLSEDYWLSLISNTFLIALDCDPDDRAGVFQEADEVAFRLPAHFKHILGRKLRMVVNVGTREELAKHMREILLGQCTQWQMRGGPGSRWALLEPTARLSIACKASARSTREQTIVLVDQPGLADSHNNPHRQHIARSNLGERFPLVVNCQPPSRGQSTDVREALAKSGIVKKLVTEHMHVICLRSLDKAVADYNLDKEQLAGASLEAIKEVLNSSALLKSEDNTWSDLIGKAVKDMPDVSEADKEVYRKTALDKITFTQLDVKSVLRGNFNPTFSIERLKDMIEDKQELLVVHVCREAIQKLVDSVLRPMFRMMQDVKRLNTLSPEEIEAIKKALGRSLMENIEITATQNKAALKADIIGGEADSLKTKIIGPAVALETVDVVKERQRKTKFRLKYLKENSRALGNDLDSDLSMPTNMLADHLMPFFAFGRLESRLTIEEGAGSTDEQTVSWIQNFATTNSRRSLSVLRDLLETKAGACEGAAVSMAYGSVQQQVQDLERDHSKELTDQMTKLIPMIVKDAIDQTAISTALANVKKKNTQQTKAGPLSSQGLLPI